ncbi:hypothetical protein H8J56_27185 [Klebsiella sp. Kps]|nr:hypothetical protein [Klebsiella sp. Kps]
MNYNDVDFCLKVRATGRRIIWSPWAAWYHFESQTRLRGVSNEERDWMAARWGAEIAGDPYYNPNHAPLRADYLELPPTGTR